MRLLLYLHFDEYVSRPEVTKLLLHEDNQTVVFVLNAMASPVMTAELRKIQGSLQPLGFKL